MRFLYVEPSVLLVAACTTSLQTKEHSEAKKQLVTHSVGCCCGIGGFLLQLLIESCCLGWFLSIADIRKSYNIDGTEVSVMSEKLSLVTCTSCGKPIPPGSESTKFLCPNCGDIQIKRDGKCRKFGRIYKCPKCGFSGP